MFRPRLPLRASALAATAWLALACGARPATEAASAREDEAAPAAPEGVVRVVDIDIVSGPILPADIEMIVSAADADLTGCYREGLSRRDQLGGRVAFSLDIDHHGDVLRGDVLASALRDRPVQACLLGVLKALQFPKPPVREGTAALIALDLRRAEAASVAQAHPTAAAPSERAVRAP